MRAIWKAALSAVAVILCAAQAPADGQAEQRAKIDRLLDAVRANDEALFATLVGGLETPRPLDPYEGPQLGDYAADPTYYGALTLASLRRFANACTYTRRNPDIPVDPLTFGGFYTCNGEAGHSLSAQFSIDGLRAVWITIMSPADHRTLAEQNERMMAEGAIADAAERAELMRVAGTVDALFAAAIAGDRGRFAALLGRGFEGGGAVLADDRSGVRQVGPLTLEALRPIAAACRRGEEEPYQTMDMSDEINQETPYICNGESGFRLLTRFEENGTKVASLHIEGRVRLPFP